MWRKRRCMKLKTLRQVPLTISKCNWPANCQNMQIYENTSLQLRSVGD